MAKEYSKLPSEILAKADTFDMLVYDVSTTYAKHIRSKANKETPDMSIMDKKGLNELSNMYYGKNIT